MHIAYSNNIFKALYLCPFKGWKRHVPEGDYLRLENQNKYENLLGMHLDPGIKSIRVLLVLLAIKLKILLDLKNCPAMLAFENATKKKKLPDIVLEKIRKFVTGTARNFSNPKEFSKGML